ncbi:glycosyltransferase family 2 protein [Lebetimonas sp. JS032]|uniref:glycosyltransferase family 2 protein n=1 Tax=Lebetimonas sp. JS032 TaxID=990070 RepID=UPI00046794CD|nr:glycosyltransferase family 2 protein [Lebetimonas sp. JS032]
MLISVLIDNYNYGKFLSECTESVLDQTYQNFEIIIVDDGSSDNSKEIIEKYANKDKRIKPIFKKNGGQASAFNEGFKHCNGEIICFLDSDDKFLPNKLKKIKEIYEKGYEYIVNDYKLIGNTAYKGPYYPYGGYNMFLVYYLTFFAGSTTSNISISKKLANQIFPIPYEKFFKIRADDVIVFISNLMTEMFFIDKELSEYRIHGDNLFACNNSDTLKDKFYRDYILHKIKKYYLDKINIEKRFFENPYDLYLEFTTKQIYDFNIFKLYLKLLFLEINAPFIKKIQIAKKMLNFYKRQKKTKLKKKTHLP